MKSATVKIKAKVNFTLDVVGKENGFHNIRSLVSTVNIADTVKVTKRKDDEVVLKCKGIPVHCDTTENNAYKAAKAFITAFGGGGVNILVNKKIPVASGLGGSSADIAGTLIAMRKLYGLDVDLKKIADELGSDSGYMLNGGLAVIEGRGECVSKINDSFKAYLIILCANGEVSAKACYEKYDELNETYKPLTDKARACLGSGDTDGFMKLLKNDLYKPSVEILPEIKEHLEYLSKFAPTVMTGSGSAVVCVFSDKHERDKAYKSVKKRYGNLAIKTRTE